MDFERLELPEVILIVPSAHGDERGFFMETYQKREFGEHGIEAEFVQDNHSRSRRGTLRGLHYQIKRAQGKLIRVVRGEIYDVSVDLRRSSASFGKWVGVDLSEENRRQIWVPPGFAHGFFVLSEHADVIYKATEFYDPRWDQTLLWNDPDLAIHWPLQAGLQPIISKKDAAGRRLKDAEVYD